MAERNVGALLAVESDESARAVLGLGEVKFIPRTPERSEEDQSISYAASFRSPHTFVIHPLGKGSMRGRCREMSIAAMRFYHYAFDLDSANLAAEEASLADEVIALLAHFSDARGPHA